MCLSEDRPSHFRIEDFELNKGAFQMLANLLSLCKHHISYATFEVGSIDRTQQAGITGEKICPAVEQGCQRWTTRVPAIGSTGSIEPTGRSLNNHAVNRFQVADIEGRTLAAKCHDPCKSGLLKCKGLSNEDFGRIGWPGMQFVMVLG